MPRGTGPFHENREFLKACQELGIKRSRLYQLIWVYKAPPLTRSLLASPVAALVLF